MALKKELLLALLAIVITFVVYYDSLNNGFIWDDYSFVYLNRSIRNPDLKGVASFFTDFRTSADSSELAKDVYRPLVTASFALDYRLWGLNQHLYHLENLALHMLNVFLVYLLVLTLASSAAIAFIASVAFAIHPVQVEAVTWISGKSNVLFLLFYLTALVVHLRRSAGSSRSAFALSLLCFTLALFAKEMAITLPLVMILYDAVFLQKRGLKGYVKYYWPFFLTAASYLIVRLSVVGAICQGNRYWGTNPIENISTTFKSLAAYIRLLLFPVNLRVDYVVDIPRSLFEPDVLLAILVLATVAVICMALRRSRIVLFFILWFFIALIPVYNIVPFKAVMAERFLYLPSIGFAAILAAALVKLYESRPGAAALLTGLLLIFYSGSTIARNVDWRNEIYLYTQDLPKSIASPRIHYNLALACCREFLGIAYAHGEQLEGLKPIYGFVEKEFKEAIRLRPDHADSYLSLGNTYDAAAQHDKALECFAKVLELEPQSAGAYNNMGIVYYKKGLYDEAIKYYRRALSLPWATPQFGYANLGNAYFKKKEYKKARMAWEIAARLAPDDKYITRNLTDLDKIGK